MFGIQNMGALQEAGSLSGSLQGTQIEQVEIGNLSFDESANIFSQDLFSAVDNLANLSKEANAPMNVQDLSPSTMLARQQAVEQLNLETQIGAKVPGQLLKGIDTLTRMQ